jgi:hypothetical protein
MSRDHFVIYHFGKKTNAFSRSSTAQQQQRSTPKQSKSHS